MDTPLDIAPEEGVDPQPSVRDEPIGGLLSIVVLVLIVYGVAFAFQNLATLA